MRVTEFIDFINREDIPDIEEYSHLEIREEKIDSEGNIKFVVKNNLKKIRSNYR